MLSPRFRRRLKRQILGAISAAIVVSCASTPKPHASGQPVIAQESSPTAEEVLRTSLKALGVKDTAIAGNTFELVLTIHNVTANWRQARRWTDSIPLSIPTRLTYAVDVSAEEAVLDLDSPAPGEIWFRYRTHYDTAGSWQIDRIGWRLGIDILRGSPAASRAALGAAERPLPHFAIRQALRNLASLQQIGGAGNQVRFRYVDARARDTIEIAIDTASHLPASVTSAGQNVVQFQNYKVVDGILVPFTRQHFIAGRRNAEQRVASIHLGALKSREAFALPKGYFNQPAPAQPSATRISGNLYRLDNLPGGYHSAFIVGDSTVDVLEAPHSIANADAALQVIAETAPGKPVRRVFVTHHHSDHVAGIPAYVSRGATIVAHESIEEAIRRQLPDSLQIRMKFKALRESGSIGSGSSRIGFYSIPNGHAEGNVAYYMPGARALFQGDLFYIPERGAVPPAFPVTAALDSLVRNRKLQVNTIVGVHGRSGSYEELERSLSLSPQLFSAGVISNANEQWRLTFTPDGKTVYFAESEQFFPVSRRARIMVSHLVAGKWTSPTVAPFSGTFSDMDPHIAPDGKRLYFSSIRPDNGTVRGDLDIWMMERTATGWSSPVRLGDEVNSPGDELYPSVSSDGTLYFASGPLAPAPGAHFDIYSAKSSRKSFAPRQPLGPGVNTQPAADDPNLQSAWDFNPEISPDGRTLIFTSLRSGGYGLGDLYVSRLAGGKWSAAQNLGLAVNSESDEYHPTMSRDGRDLYFVRRVPAKGNFYKIAVTSVPALRSISY